MNPLYTSAKSIGKNNVNIRSCPNLKSRILFEAPLGYPIKIKRRQGDWIVFRDWENKSGWVYKPLVSDIDTAVVVAVRANLRSGPGLKNEVIGKVVQGDIYKIIAKNGNWVDLGYYYGGDPAGWVRSDLVFGD